MACATLGLEVKAQTPLMGLETHPSSPAEVRPGLAASPLQHPGFQPWLLLLLPLLLLLSRPHRSKLKQGWDWVGFTLAALLAPLRSRRNVIHDRRYLDQLLQAEAKANPKEWQGSGSNRSGSGRGQPQRGRQGQGGGRAGERRSGPKPSGSGDSSRRP